MPRYYAAIDLKSFYASVECNERGLDPLATNLVVADSSRTEKTICLAVSPSLKSYGLPGRARLFQVIEKVREINADRLAKAPLHVFLGQSSNNQLLQQNPNLALDYIVATPRMKYYLDYSARIYNIYLNHIAPDDIYAYSIDEVFCDITSYLNLYKLTPSEFITKIISDIHRETGITATAGIGTNMFLAKVAMDILAKHTAPNSAGVRIAELDEQSFRKQLWAHQPITDFWRVGRGYARRLMNHDIYTMGDIARCSISNEKLLYDLFGVNAELLIDHAWGYENVEIADAKSYHAATKSLSSGQVLSCPYSFEKAKIILREMAENLSLELVQKGYAADQLVLHIDYDKTSLTTSAQNTTTKKDHYGRRVPKPAHGTYHLPLRTASTRLIIDGFLEIYHQYVNPNFMVRKITVIADNLIDENLSTDQPEPHIQMDFFTNYAELERQKQVELKRLQDEKQVQKAILKIRERYGKNAILRGTNFEAGATARNRHYQIGGHRA